LAGFIHWMTVVKVWPWWRWCLCSKERRESISHETFWANQSCKQTLGPCSVQFVALSQDLWISSLQRDEMHLDILFWMWGSDHCHEFLFGRFLGAIKGCRGDNVASSLTLFGPEYVDGIVSSLL